MFVHFAALEAFEAYLWQPKVSLIDKNIGCGLVEL
jgi:hypothetical protein